MTAATSGDTAGPVDLAALAEQQHGPVPLWPERSTDLHINVLRFDPGTGVAEHVNAELDVLLVGVAGEGSVTVDGARWLLVPGHALLIPKGARRAISAGSGGLSYLSCHRRRGLLWPGPPPAPGTRSAAGRS